MADRLDALDGHLTITSTPSRGTDITGRIPARATKAAPPSGIGG